MHASLTKERPRNIGANGRIPDLARNEEVMQRTIPRIYADFQPSIADLRRLTCGKFKARTVTAL